MKSLLKWDTFNTIILIIITLLLLSIPILSFSKSNIHDTSSFNQTPVYKGTVVETMNSGGYTYVQLNLGDKKIWIAGPQMAVNKGEVLQTFSKGGEMRDFKSKSLNKEFPVIFFVGNLYKEGTNPFTQVHDPDNLTIKEGRSSIDLDFRGLKKPLKGYTVEQIYAKKATLLNQEINLRAKVVKANSKIMGKNWYHIQDGTGQEGKNDLILTSQDKVEPGNTVLVKGTLVKDKDFGNGYKYDLMLVNAKLKVEK